jgi:hypothetical protein
MKKAQACDAHAEDSHGDIIDRPCGPQATFKQAKSEVLGESWANRNPETERWAVCDTRLPLGRLTPLPYKWIVRPAMGKELFLKHPNDE